MMAQRRRGRAGHAPRPPRPGVRRGLGLRRGRPRHRHGRAHDLHRRGRRRRSRAAPRRRSTPLATAAFAAMDATSNSGICRPFDARRDGFVMGEGAGVLVLEDARGGRGARREDPRRGLGYGASADAHHLTAPEPEGRGAASAIQPALRMRDLEPEDIDYVNAHGTSTPLNDRAETAALKAALGDRAAEVPVSSTKSAIGHLLGAAGAVEAIATVLALRDEVAPPTLGYEQPDEGLDLDYVPGAARAARSSTASSVSARCRTRSASAVTTPCSAWRLTVTATVAIEPAPRLGAARAPRAPVRPGHAAASSAPRSPRRGWASKARPGDGVVGAAGRVGGRPVFCLRAGRRLRRRLAGRAARRHDRARPASWPGAPAPRSSASSSPAARACRRASRRSAATAGSSASNVALSGRVPQISVITGTSAGGGSYSPALTDFVIMTRERGDVPHRPRRRARGHGRGRRRGRARRHRACTSATASATASPTTAPRPIALARDLLAYLPQSACEPRRDAPASPAARRPTRARSCPPTRARVYDVREVMRRARRRRATCSRSRRAGRATSSARSRASRAARSASSPTSRATLGGVLDADSAQKAARFVRTCNTYGLPLVVLVDTPGLPARHAPGARRRHPPRRQARCTRSPRRPCRA